MGEFWIVGFGVGDYNMGLTESHSKQDAEDKYKLIRRYTSDCYGDLTVIQHKQSQRPYALKQLITEDNLILEMIQARKNFTHPNIIKLQQFWFSGDNSICSNIRKLQMVFEYFPITLEDEMKGRADRGEGFGEGQILQIFQDTIEALRFLDQFNFLHLLGGMKMILYDSATKVIKIIQNQEIFIISQRSKKKQLNVIGLVGSKKMLPLHPANQPRDVGDVCLSSDKVAHQNLFVLGIVCLSLCWMKEPIELGIFGRGGYLFDKIDKRINQIKSRFPRIHKILSSYMSQCKRIDPTYNEVVSVLNNQKNQLTKQNERSQRILEMQAMQKVGEKRNKKLPYLREMRLSNNDLIPNEF